MNEQWDNIINRIFNDKKNLLNEFLSSSRISNHDKFKKSIVIKVDKNYLNRILITRINELKKELEQELNDYVFNIKINDKNFEFNSTSINESISHVKKEDIENVPISYRTTEKIMSGTYSARKVADEKYKKRKTDLFFYNKFLYSTKKITVNYKILHNDVLLKYSLYFSWTIIIPFILLINVLSNKITLLKLKKEVKNLLNLKYIALNQETEKFIKLYI